MTDTELLQRLIKWVVEKARFDTDSPNSPFRQAGIAAFESGEDRTIKILALMRPDDRLLDSLSYLIGARRLAESNPVTGFTTLKESINALTDIHPDGKALWSEVQNIIQDSSN